MSSGILWPIQDIKSGEWYNDGTSGPAFDLLYASLANRCGVEDIGCWVEIDQSSFPPPSDTDFIVKVQPTSDPTNNCCHYVQFIGSLESAGTASTVEIDISGCGINNFIIDGTRPSFNISQTGWTTYTYELTPTEAAKITDYTDIHLYFNLLSPAGFIPNVRIGLAYFYVESQCPGQKITFTVPTGDVSAGDWATAPLYSKINSGIIGGVGNLSDYIDTIASPSTPFEVHLSGGPDASSDECHVLRYVASLDAYYGSENVDLDIGLYDGTTLIKEETKTLTSVSWVTGEMTLSAAEAANITNYQNLRVKGSGSDSAGGNTPRIAEIEFQYPYTLDLTQQQWPASYLHFV